MNINKFLIITIFLFNSFSSFGMTNLNDINKEEIEKKITEDADDLFRIKSIEKLSQEQSKYKLAEVITSAKQAATYAGVAIATIFTANIVSNQLIIPSTPILKAPIKSLGEINEYLDDDEKGISGVIKAIDHYRDSGINHVSPYHFFDGEEGLSKYTNKRGKAILFLPDTALEPEISNPAAFNSVFSKQIIQLYFDYVIKEPIRLYRLSYLGQHNHAHSNNLLGIRWEREQINNIKLVLDKIIDDGYSKKDIIIYSRGIGAFLGGAALADEKYDGVNIIAIEGCKSIPDLARSFIVDKESYTINMIMKILTGWKEDAQKGFLREQNGKRFLIKIKTDNFKETSDLTYKMNHFYEGTVDDSLVAEENYYHGTENNCYYESEDIPWFKDLFNSFIKTPYSFKTKIKKNSEETTSEDTRISDILIEIINDVL